MSIVKFSPPPWRIETLKDGTLVVMSADERDVCTMSINRLTAVSGAHINRHADNAKLVAMAPQLLLALKDADEVLRGIAGEIPSFKGRLEAYASLIAKATA